MTSLLSLPQRARMNFETVHSAVSAGNRFWNTAIEYRNIGIVDGL